MIMGHSFLIYIEPTFKTKFSKVISFPATTNLYKLYFCQDYETFLLLVNLNIDSTHCWILSKPISMACLMRWGNF